MQEHMPFFAIIIFFLQLIIQMKGMAKDVSGLLL